MSDDEVSIKVWNNVVTAILKMPGAKVNRDKFLKKELSKYYDQTEVTKVIESGYKDSIVDSKVIGKIAKSIINTHTTIVTSISFGYGLPGGWWMAGTIPADLTNFYYQVVVVAQELAYIYGWPSFDEDGPTEEFIGIITLFIGVMSGTKAANEALGKMANNLATQVAKRLPQKALTKYGIYNIVKKIAAWFGVRLTKDSFSKGVSKAIPVLGGIISGAVTAGTFMPMAKKLKNYLATLPLAKGGKEYISNEQDLEIC